MEHDQEDKGYRSSEIGDSDDGTEECKTISGSDNPRDSRETRIFHISNGYIALSMYVHGGEGRIRLFSRNCNRPKDGNDNERMSDRVKAARANDYKGLALSFPFFYSNRNGEGPNSIINWLKALGWEPNKEKEERLKEVLRKRDLNYE